MRFAGSMLVLLCGAVPGRAQVTATFRTEAPRSGLRFRVRSVESTDVQTRLHMGAREVDGGRQASTLDIARTETVVQVDAEQKIAQLLIHYETAEQKNETVLGPEKFKVKVDAHPYLIRREDSAFVVIDQERQDVADSIDADIVRLHARRIFDRAVIEGLLQAGPVRVGSVLEAGPAVARYVLGDEEIDCKNMRWKLQAISEVAGREVASFLVECTTESSLPAPMKGRSSWVCSGPVEVDVATSRITKVQLSGPVTVEGELAQGGVELRISGSGASSRELTVEFLELQGR